MKKEDSPPGTKEETKVDTKAREPALKRKELLNATVNENPQLEQEAQSENVARVKTNANKPQVTPFQGENQAESNKQISSKGDTNKKFDSQAYSLGNESEKGDVTNEPRHLLPSIGDVLEPPRTPTRDRLGSTTGSKYTPLLKVDRQDSMRGSFQLKLMPSDSADTTPRSSMLQIDHGQSAFSRQDTQGPAELRNRSASLHVLIPPKEEKNETEKVYINKFHETVDEKKYHVSLTVLLTVYEYVHYDPCSKGDSSSWWIKQISFPSLRLIG